MGKRRRVISTRRAPVIVYGSPPKSGAPDFGDREVIYMPSKAKHSSDGVDGTTMGFVIIFILITFLGVVGYIYRDRLKEALADLKNKSQD